MKRILQTLKQYNYLIVLFAYMFVVFAFLASFYIPYFKISLKEIIDFGIVTFLLVIPFTIAKSKIFNRFWIIFAVSSLAFTMVFKLTFYHHYGVRISASALFVIFETNATETSSFLSEYFDLQSVFISILAIIPLLFILLSKVVRKQIYKLIELNFSFLQKSIILLLGVISVFVVHKKLKAENIALVSYYAYNDYIDYKSQLKSELNTKTSPFLKDVSKVETPQTHIFVIGESTSRWNMQLYGYPRETNPELSKLKNELLVFNDVISPNTHTILALDKILTLSDINNPNKTNNASVVQLANMAGYKTYWLSNQRPVGINESIASIMSNASNKQVFANTENTDIGIFDENLLPSLKSVLENDESKRVIFLHLLGTHGAYDKRYPYRFDHFDYTDYPSENKSSKAKRLINTYDNAVRYNDYIISEIITALKNSNVNSSLVYFSDHGDDVYWNADKYLGHNEYHGTKPMYDVPFLIWLSDKEKHKQWNHKQFLQRPYNLEDFIHTFSDIIGVDFDGYKADRSILNINFSPKQRLIKNCLDYDAKN